MEILCRLHEVEEIVSEMDLYHVPDDILECDEDYQIVISGWWVYIPELGINLYEGVFCNYDEQEQAFLPDFSITIIKEAEEIKEGEWLYYEQDGFAVTLANYLNGTMELGRIKQLSCLICIPEMEPEA